MIDKPRSDLLTDREPGNESITARPTTSNQSIEMGERVSPVRILFITMSGIFLAEIVAMILIAQLPEMLYAVQTVLDALIMVALVYPVLYYLVFRSLLVHIAERKQAEQAIQQSEALLRKVLENLPVGVWITDQKGKLIHGNPASQQIWAGERLVGIEQYGEYKAWWLDSGEPIAPEEWAAARAITRGEISLNEEIEIEAFDGTHKIILNSAVPILDEQNSLQGAIVVNEDITERKRSERLFRIALESLSVGVWISDETGKIIYGNPAGQQIWAGARYVGIDQFGEYKGWWLSSGKRIGPEEWAVARAIQRGETSLDEEIEIECFDGTHKIILNSAIPIQDERLRILGAFVVNQDITERKRAEKDLRLANAYNRSLIEASLDPLVTISIDGKITDVNSATEKVTGCSRTELVGTDFSDYFTEPKRARAGYQQVFLDGAVHDYALEIRHKDGHTTPVLYNATLYSDEADSVMGVFAAARDITERKRYEKELIESKELIETAFNSIDIHIAYMDREFNFIRVNEAYARAAGHPAEYFVSKNHFDLYPHAENQAIFQRVVETGVPFSVFEKPFEYAEFPERGITYWDWNLQPVMGIDNVVKGVVLSLIEVTERKRAELQLERQNQELRALSDSERRQRELAETLRAAAQALTQTLELDQVLNTLLESITAITHADTAGIALFEGETRLAPRAAQGYERWTDLDQILSLSVEANENPALQRLISTHKSILVSDTKAFPGWQEIPGLEAICSWLGVPLLAGDKLIGVVGLGKIETGYFTQEHVQWAEALVGQAAMAIQNAWLFEQVRASSERLQGLSHRLVEVQESERRYIASELHDEVGQALTSLMVGLQLIEKEATSEKVKLEAADMNKVLDNVMENLHRLAMDLRPASLDYLGLESALQQHVEMMSEKQDLQIQFAMTGISERLPANFEIAFYRIVQEALNNVARHAHATQVDVLITQREDCLVLMIEDDGVGFIPTEAIKGKRLGLSGMRERAEMLGGKLTIESIPGKGSTILVEVPYANPGNSRR